MDLSQSEEKRKGDLSCYFLHLIDEEGKRTGGKKGITKSCMKIKNIEARLGGHLAS